MFTKTQKWLEYQDSERKEFNGKLIDFLNEQLLNKKIVPETLEQPLPEQLKILHGHTREECIALLDGLKELREYVRKRRKRQILKTSGYYREHYSKEHPNAGHYEVYVRVYKYPRHEYFKQRYHKKHPNAKRHKTRLTRRVLIRNGKPVKNLKQFVPLGTEKPLLFNKCLNCGKGTPYKKFCSRECFRATQNKKRLIIKNVQVSRFTA